MLHQPTYRAGEPPRNGQGTLGKQRTHSLTLPQGFPMHWPIHWRKSIHLLLLIALLWAQLANMPVASVKAQSALTTDAVQALRLENGLLLWSTYCGGELYPAGGYVRSLPAGGGSQRTLHSAGACGIDRVASNVISDARYFYWQTSNRIVRLPRSAAAGAAPQTITTKATAGSTGEITQDALYLYWSEGTSLFRTRKATGSTRETLFGDPAAIRALRSIGDERVLYIGRNGLQNVFYNGGGGLTVISRNAQSYALDGGTLYWVERVGAGPQLAIRRAPVNGPYEGAPLQTIDGAGNPTVPTLAVDGTNLYWFEERARGGPIMRMNKNGGTPEAMTLPLTSISDLVSNGRDLFWHNRVSIQRMATNAAAISVDLVPGPVIEVVQAIQNPFGAPPVPLVQGKETFVRLYPRIAGGTLTTVTTWPPVTLTGRRDGVTLGQLVPINRVPQTLGTATMDRTQLAGSFLFRLPAEWTRGRVELTAEVNPNRFPETDTTNNRIVSTVDFTRKAPMCLDIVPVETVRGRSISSWEPNGSLQAFFDRASALLPTEAIRTFWRGGPALRKPRWYLLDSDPFTVSNAAPDGQWLIFWLNFSTLFGSDPGGCGAANATTSRVAMLQDLAEREVNGMSGGWSLLFFAFLAGPSAQNTPGGGVTLAHELAHLYGRGHVDCPVGLQAGIDRAYPYPTCLLDVSATANIGFDPITQQLVLPGVTGDLMSAAHRLPTPRWSSDYTWRGLFNRLPTRSMIASAAMTDEASVAGIEVTPAAAASTFVVSGILSNTTVLFNHTYAATGALQEQFIRHIAAGTEASRDYEVRAYDDAGNLVVSAPLALIPVDEGDPAQMPFITRLDLAVEPSRIEVARIGGEVLGTLSAGATPPAVAITSPAPGSEVTDTMEIAWNGSDADGDLLRYVVRYSTDNGANWISLDAGNTGNRLVVNMREGMPGGEEALVQVLASDGLHTTIATSEPFRVLRHAPSVAILNSADESVSAGMSVAAQQSDMIVLRGRGYDAEDGPLAETALQWNVSGPVTRMGDGEQLTLFDLPPGRYTVDLHATDSDGQTAEAQTTLVVTPKRVFDSDAPLLDGYCDDATYGNDLDPIRLRPSAETTVEVRMVHAGESIYFCFGGIPLDISGESSATLRIDPDNSGGDVATASDLVFTVSLDGSISSAVGDGAGSFTEDEAPQGIEAAVSSIEDRWSAEMRIDVDRLGGWERLIHMQVGYFSTDRGDSHPLWPVESDAVAPSTWGLAALGQQPQTITFDPLANQSTATPAFAVIASASSGLPVRYGAEGSCAVYSNLVTPTGAGRCTITATQPGDAVYTPAESVQQSFEITEIPVEVVRQSIYLPTLSK